MARMSNRDRIARAAEEARLAEAEKLARKPDKRPAKPASKRAAKDVRLKVVWEVCNGSGKPVKTFAYPDKAAAEAEVQALSKSTGRTHSLRPAKVPME